jgi:DNA-binding GntR family transcriptional regulator
MTMKKTQVGARDRGKASKRRGDSVAAAFEKLRDLIVMGQVAPGSWVVETEFAEHLGMSRTPIRGALQLLQREGFIIEQRGGTKVRLRVSPLTNEDAQELYMIANCLEMMAGALTAALPEEPRQDLCVRLRGLNERLHQIATGRKVEPRFVFELDTQFHREIVLASAGPRLQNLHAMVKPQLERYWRLYAHSLIQNLRLSVSEHEKIVNAIASGNAQATENAVANNWKHGAERICRQIDQFGERGSW